MPLASSASASTFTDYTSRGSGGAVSAKGDGVDAQGYWALGKLKSAYMDYLHNKRDEINEQQDARRYRHGAHWTAEQIAVLNKRRQPIVTYNRIGRKIDGVVGIVVKQRADPKAYPRTPKHEQGAELGTATLRFKMDEQNWDAKDPICAEKAATEGIGGLAMELIPGEQGDYDVGFYEVEIEDYFYDPRSIKPDFSDVRYEGEAKWVDVDTAKELVPEMEDQIDALAEGSGSELTTNSDREQRWFSGDGTSKRIRLVECWYRHKGEWCWCLFTGSMKLKEGKSPFYDDKGKTCSKFEMFSAAVDHDGDRYGFPRNLKSANDEINARRSKGLFELNSRRIFVPRGSVEDVEKTRAEMSRPDGVIEYTPMNGMKVEADDQRALANIEGSFKFLEDAKAEIENFGPNPALIGQGLEHQSGRAISLLQQAGIAELGPFILSYRGWKIRVYRKVWNAIQRYWTGEKWVRVTDDEGLAQFILLNQLGIDPQTGQPTIINAIGQLDVDIIIDEGPDTVTVQAETNDALAQMLSSVGALLPPAKAAAAVDLLIETSALSAEAKKKFREAGQQPDPAAEKAKEIALAGEAAKVDETKSKAMLNMAKAQSEGMPEPGAPMQMPEAEVPIEVQTMETLAKVKDIIAAAELKRVQAAKVGMETSLMPMKTMHEQHMAEMSHQANVEGADADREVQMKAMRARSQQRSQGS